MSEGPAPGPLLAGPGPCDTYVSKSLGTQVEPVHIIGD